MTSEDKLLIYDKVEDILLDLESEWKRMVSRSQFVAMTPVDKSRLRFLENIIEKTRIIMRIMEK